MQTILSCLVSVRKNYKTQDMISKLNDRSKQLEMNEMKTKIMNNIIEDTHISLVRALLEKVDNYMYLAQKITRRIRLG